MLWGTDNLKTEGGPIAQALALMGAQPRFDSYGRLAGAELIPLDELGRPRIDVVITLSGIFRDLLPLQIKLLAEAAFLAASGRRAARAELRPQARAGLPGASTAATSRPRRCASSAMPTAPTAPTSTTWSTTAAGTTRTNSPRPTRRRKGFAYGRNGRAGAAGRRCCSSVLAGVELAYQNLDSVELGVTTVDHYFDTLGGISRAVRARQGRRRRRRSISATRPAATARCARWREQVALETRTRMLNPKWYEGMLEHGYEGVRQIEAHVTNTMGWSATTGQVAPWVYQQLTETFMLDPEMRERLAQLNPTASAKVANRLLEAHERNYWHARRRHARRAAAAPARSSKTASKASTKEPPHERSHDRRRSADDRRRGRARPTARAACRCSSTRT